MTDGRWPWPRRYAITSATGIIGYTNLEYALEWRQRAAGVMSTAPSYAEVRSIFALYPRAAEDRELLRQFRQARDALQLRLEDGGTLPLAATIELISEWEGRRVMVYARITDERYWLRRTRPRS